MPQNENEDGDSRLFRAELSGVKKLKQDTIKLPCKNVRKKQFIQQERLNTIEINHFSDEFQSPLPEEGPMRYIRTETKKHLIKQLGRGDFAPEITIDLHGLNKETTKKELAAFISCCKKEGLYCGCVIHGLGTYVLKKQVPQWLAQHPDILAFHQAPLKYGGTGALLVLVELDDWQMKPLYAK